MNVHVKCSEHSSFFYTGDGLTDSLHGLSSIEVKCCLPFLLNDV